VFTTDIIAFTVWPVTTLSFKTVIDVVNESLLMACEWLSVGIEKVIHAAHNQREQNL
jgi:hypothetical protein